MSEAKERPIIFSAPMVREILAGRKTQTRRVLKVQPIDIIPMSVPNKWVSMTDIGPTQGEVFNCRYGNPGDLLWVRETFCPDWCDHPIYRADGGSAIEAGYSKEPRWKPSIHMRRHYSRITLEITGVRVERVQNITESDALAEGVWEKDEPYQGVGDLPIDRFRALWDTINAKRGYSWESNPFVWVLSFKVITPANNAMQATRLRVASASA